MHRQELGIHRVPEHPAQLELGYAKGSNARESSSEFRPATERENNQSVLFEHAQRPVHVIAPVVPVQHGAQASCRT